MIRAAIIGLGTRGQHLVRCAGGARHIRFTAAATRTTANAADFAAALEDPEIDAAVLATPHTQHTHQIVAAAAAGKP
jgi:predicted dehydrogenase